MESTVGDRLRVAREARGLGSAELSIAIGASHSLVSQIERGKTKQLQADTALRLARALDVPPEWLVLGEGTSPFPVKPAKKPARKSPKPTR